VVVIDADHERPFPTEHFGKARRHRALSGAGVSDNADNDGLRRFSETWLRW
jgi:hypothetical protein